MKRRTLKFSEIGAAFKPKAPLKPIEIAERKRSPLLTYILGTMNKYPDAVVMTQVGSFYEMYFHHATEFGPKLDLKIAKKRQSNPLDSKQTYVPMTGFPVSQLSKFARQLVHEWGKNVVVLTQQQEKVFQKASEEEKRPVSRILTPGTVIEDDLDSSSQLNYIAAVYVSARDSLNDNSPVAIAWVDLGDGSLHYKNTNVSDLASSLGLLNPKELVLDTVFRDSPKNSRHSISSNHYHTSYHHFPAADSLTQFKHLIDQPEKSFRSLCDSMSLQSQKAISALLSYLQEALPNTFFKYKAPQEFQEEDILRLDKLSQDALEIFKVSQRESREGSLFSVIRRTTSPAGSRLLQERLAAPSSNITQIRKRLEYVDFFHSQRELCSEIVETLTGVPDGKRVIQKLSMQKIDLHKLSSWTASVKAFDTIKQKLESFSGTVIDPWLQALTNSLPDLNKVARKIQSSITENLNGIVHNENPIMLLRGFKLYVKSNHAKLKGDLQRVTAILKRLEHLQEAYSDAYADVGRLSIRYSSFNGYHCHLKFTTAQAPKLENAILLTQAKSSMCFTQEELQKLAGELEVSFAAIDRIQMGILDKLRRDALAVSEKKRVCAEIVAKLDFYQSLATLAHEKELCKPFLVEDHILDIKGGRNLTVEEGLRLEGQSFTRNDCVLSKEKSASVVTGPNMGGKSTFIRQVAIICLLAQMGSYVPASSATIGIVDRIFCRIGSGDEISRGRSTFFVEMMETSNILRCATPRSLAILDEVGRGTSEKDGIAISYASLKHIIRVNKARTLFATHYGKELQTALLQAGITDEINFLKTEPKLTKELIGYDWALKEGISVEPHGLAMAKLAGYPQEALQMAEKVYKRIDSQT